jgi:hypothetical protein
MERGVVRNLLGRLNARPPGDIARIAERWNVPLSGTEMRRQVGALYRTMTDIRAARAFYANLTPDTAAIVRGMALADRDLLTLPEIAALIDRPEDATRDAAVWLFFAGVLAREGDRQELPVGAVPRLFLPRELEQVFTRVVDEIELGDMRRESLRSLMAIVDASDIEEAAPHWGIQVIPGLRGRDELTEELLELMDDADRVRRVASGLSGDAAGLWRAVRDAAEADGGLPYADALIAAGLLKEGERSPRSPRQAERIRDVLEEVEGRLLVRHSYDDAGNRWLFVPDEVRNPGTRLRNLPLEPLMPAPAEEVTADPARQPHAVAWDVLTIQRELVSHRSPVWQPGEPLARSWQRQLNPRLWLAGESAPPEGYAGFLLSLAYHVGLVEPDEKPVRAGAEKGAFRPRVTDMIRSWRSRAFSAQTGALRDGWLSHEAWIEGRERDEIEVWGAWWPDVRANMLEAIGTLETGAWFRHRELARHLAQQHPALLGSVFTVASARGSGDADTREARAAKIAQVIAIELETAFRWFGLVETGTVGTGTKRTLVLRLTDLGRAASQRPDIVPEDDARLPGTETPPDAAPVLTVSETGEIALLRPAPLHVWSLSAFSEPVALEPVARYELTKPSLGRALGAGFDLDQVVTYLERQSGEALPERVLANLRDWTTGYRRVRLRRLLMIQPDDPALIDDLVGVLGDAGYELADPTSDGGGVRVYLPDAGDDGAAVEDALLKTLRANGFAGQWPRPESGSRRQRD